MSKLLKFFLVILFLFLMNNCSEDNPVEPEKNYSGMYLQRSIQRILLEIKKGITILLILLKSI